MLHAMHFYSRSFSDVMVPDTLFSQAITDSDRPWLSQVLDARGRTLRSSAQWLQIWALSLEFGN